MGQMCGLGMMRRAAGIDKFDTFTLAMVFDKVQYLESFDTNIRVTAGHQVVNTKSASSQTGIHETLDIEVRQGTQHIKFELCEVSKFHTNSIKSVHHNSTKSESVLAHKTLSVDEVQRLAES